MRRRGRIEHTGESEGVRIEVRRLETHIREQILCRQERKLRVPVDRPRLTVVGGLPRVRP
jgi:hypothetical protein